MTMQQFCLRWNNHQPNFISVFSSLLNSETLVDVTLAAEGRHLQAHKVVLSACSSYFQSLFSINPCQHPIVILKDVKFIHLKVMVDFMYYGEVNVSQEQLPHILKTAEMLKIKGLAEMPDSTSLTKSQSGSTERAELLTPGDSNWSSDVRRSLSPSPCPLSPSARRKRLRKSSTGSGSGSTERTSEEHPTEAILSSPGGSTISHIKVEQIKNDSNNLTTESNPSLRIPKQHSSDSDLQRESSQESVEDQPHQITLQVPQTTQQTTETSSIIQQNIESTPAPTDISSQPSTSTGITQSQLTGLQWAFVEHTNPRYAPTLTQMTVNIPQTSQHYNQNQNDTDPSITECTINSSNEQSITDHPCQTIYHSPNSSPSNLNSNQINLPTKRKRSVNPQADENFVRALEAVRFGGIGFCKAARLYGVNNRTLWLEYKKRGYPINRPSIKNRVKQEFGSPMEQNQQQMLHSESPPEQQPIICTPQPLDMVSAAFSNEFPEDMRARFHDTAVLAAAQINIHDKVSPTVGTKRGRLLMRQPRVKKESDLTQPSTDSDRLSPGPFLTVPPSRVERQCSEPMPSSNSPPPMNLLSIPTSGILVKQHSHPLLPSHSQQGILVKQHSHPLLPSQTQQQTSPVPVTHFLVPTTTSGDERSERSVSPVVIVTDPLSTSSPSSFSVESAAHLGTATLRVRTDELKRSASSPQTGSPRSSHCPVVRSGPALGCNFCWNTVDAHGRILRRKTKYHCPECQTNLCIVPCFQEYHERHNSGSPADPIALTTSVMRIFPKTSSM